MTARLVWQEVRQQIGGRVFWIVFAVSAMMVAGGMAIDELRVGLSQEGARTGAAQIVRTHLVWTLFFLFTAAAFVGEAVQRDEATGFGELVRATAVDPRSYALGRFLGAFGAVLLCFLSVPLAFGAGGTVLGLGLGPTGAHLFAFFALALPNLFLACALFFALTSLTRSMTGSLLGAAGLLTLYGLASDGGSAGLSLLEPFGLAAVADVTAGWSPAQRDATWPTLGGALLANRLVWLAVGVTMVALGTWLAARRAPWKGVRYARCTGKAHRADPPNFADQTVGERRTARSLHARPGWSIVAAQLWVRTLLEVRRAAMTPVFAVLLLMGLASAAAAAARVTGTPATVAALANSFRLVPIVVALFFAGELFWAEREHNVASIVAATPAGRAVLVLPKFITLALLLLLLALTSAAAGALTEVANGQRPMLAGYLAWYAFPKSYEWLLLGVLALFLQSLAPSKLAGWGYMVFYLIGSLALSRLGWQDPHYRYGGYPGVPLPPTLSGAQGVGWYRVGWGMVAATMIALACKRGLPATRELA
ncbi:ABC transporter permease [uncultured Sphingomonas sp.]|uniref:ABC transporter permease n=1 Tax=uncultured Sphingomonas sp. TaxID=158754 RepID=UPI0035CA3CB9